MPIFCQKVAVSVTSFATNPDISLDFEPKNVAVMSQDTDASLEAEVSFDGVNVHGYLKPTTPSAALLYENPPKKIWLKVTSGAAVIQVIAEQ